MRGWEALRDRGRAIRQAGRQARLGRVRPRDRMDPALGAVLAGTLMLLALAGGALAVMERARGLFDSPLLEAVEDRRILADYRDGSADFVDAVTHAGQAVLARGDGSLHLYDPETELFSEDAVPRNAALSSAVETLASGCVAGADCAPNDPLYAVTEAGGLAMRAGGRWSVLLSDSAWIGPDGTPVEQEDIRRWATSRDGRWVLIWAGDKGLGLFDQRAGRWIGDVAQAGQVQSPDRIVWAHGTFWLGGAGGLETLKPLRPSDRSVVGGVAGEILDLDVTPGGDVLMLQSAGCGAATCLSILKATGTGQARRLVGEDQIAPNLSETSVSHAALQAGKLLVLGEAGVHVYDPDRRAWQVIEANPVDAFHAGTGGEVIHFAARDRVAQLSDGRARRERKAPGRVTQILPVEGAGLFVLLRDGAVYEMSGSEPRQIAFPDAGLPENARFFTAATWRDTVIFLGGQGALLHDLKARRYGFARDVLPAGLSRGRLLVGSRALWLVDEARGRIYAGALSGDWPNRRVDFTPRAVLAGGIADAAPDGNRLLLVGRDRRSYALAASGDTPPQPLMGRPPMPGEFAIRSAVGTGSGLVLSDGSRIAAYSQVERDWSPAFAGPADGVADLALTGDHVLALTPTGKVFAAAGNWEPVIGGSEGAALGLGELTDAMAGRDRIWLAGDGRVTAYRPDLRRFEGVYTGGRGAVRLLDGDGLRPLSWSAGALFSGAQRLTPPGERVLSAGMTPGGAVYMAEEDGRRYAVALASQRCLFRGGGAPSGPLRDARALPGGRVFAATDRGWGLYEPANRRWVRLQGGGLSASGHVEIIDGRLLVIDRGTLKTVSAGSLPEPDSCDASVQLLQWDRQDTARQVTLDRDGKAVYLLGEGGDVRVWQGGQVRQILQVPSTAPTLSALHRAYRWQDELVFAAFDGIWRYDTGRRVWRRRAFEAPGGRMTEVDLTLGQDGRALVTLWDGRGQTWGGAEADGAVTFRPLRLPALPVTAIAPGEILDIAEGSGFTAILGRDRLEIFRGGSYGQRITIQLGRAEQGWSLARVEGAARLVLLDGPAEAPQRLFVIDLNSVKTGAAELADVAFAYRPGRDRDWRIGKTSLWRIDAGLELWACGIAPGGRASDGCRRMRRAPMAFDQDDVRAALHDGGDGYFLLLRDRVVHVDARDRHNADLRGLSVGAGARMLSKGGTALFWEGRGGGLYRLRRDGRAETVLNGVEDLRWKSGGLVATMRNGLWLVQDDGSVVPPRLGDLGLAAVTVGPDGALHGMDTDGRPRSSRWRGKSDGLLRFPADTVAVFPGQTPRDGAARQGWWRQAADGHVWFDWVDTCTRPLEVTPGPDDGLRGPPGPLVEDYPCPKSVRSGLRLPAGARLMHAETGAADPVLVTSAGTWLLKGEALTVVDREDWTQALAETSGDADALRRVRGKLRAVDGVSYLAPPEMRAVGSGAFIVAFGNGDIHDENGGRPAALPSFDLGWFGWERAAKQVRIGRTALTPEQALDGGVFLPAVPGRGAYLGGDRFVMINRHGLWQVVTERSAEPLRLAPMQEVVGLAHGRFLFARGRVNVATGQSSPDSDTVTLRVGALEITEQLRGGGTSARIEVSGQPVNADGTTGFLFDRRLGVAGDFGRAVILTPLGLFDAQNLSAGRAVPEGTTALDTEGGSLRLQAGGRWWRWDGRWVAAPVPRRDMVLAVENGRRWQRVDGRAEVVAIDPAEGWRVAAQGLDFEADRLIALAAGPSGTVIVTGTGTHAPPDFAGLAALHPPADRDPGVRRLDNQPVGPGQVVIWAETGQGRLVWDAVASQWQAPPPDARPWQERLAVERDGIRLTFSDGQPAAAVAVTDLGGGTTRAGFTWSRGGQMPFDRVTGLYAEGDRVLAATGFGLRQLEASGPALLNRSLYSGSPAGAPPLAFDRVGRPDSAPQRLRAEAGGRCFEMSGPAAAPQPCADRSDRLDTRFVLRNGLWHWRKSDGGAGGTYLARDGSALMPVPGEPGAGWPHDQLRRLMACAGVQVELWASQDVAALRTGKGAAVLDRLPGAGALHCQPRAAELGGGSRLAAGAYAVGGRAAWRQDAGRGWLPEPQSGPVAARAAQRLAWEGSRLRLTLTDGQAGAEYRGHDDSWRALDWRMGRIALDRVQGLAGAAGALHVMTPAGFHRWSSRGAGGLDPERLSLRSPDDPDGFAGCRPAVLEPRDGSVQAVPAAPGGPLLVACADGRRFEGRPDARRDKGAFRLTDTDPFADRVLVRDGPWVVTRKAASRDGGFALTFRFRDEPIALSAGRFSIDDYAGLAAPFPDRIETVTRAAGWWRSPARDLGAGTLVRGPKQARPETVTALWSDKAGETPVLCMSGAARLALGQDGKVARAGRCRDRAGRDAIWSWFNTEAGPEAEGRALNGVVLQRRLEAGRFTDLVVTGAPMNAADGSLFAPTRRGALKLGPVGPDGIVAAPGDGWLAPAPDGSGVLLSRAGPEALAEADGPACTALAEVATQFPEEVRVRRAEPLAPDLTQLALAVGDRPVQLLVPCGDHYRSTVWTLPLDVADRARLRAVSQLVARNRLSLSLEDGTVAVSDGRSGITAPQTLKEQIRALVPTRDARAALILGQRALYRIDTDRALSLLAQSRDPAPALTGPFAKPIVPAAPAPAPRPKPKAPRPRSARPEPQPSPQPAEVATPAGSKDPAPRPAPRPAAAKPDPEPDTGPPVQLTYQQVVRVQAVLRKQGFYKGMVDGIIGPQSRAAIQAWQEREGQTPTGALTGWQLQRLLEQGQ